MTFRTAVEATPDLAGAFRDGLQALKPKDRDRISVQTTRCLRGSVDLDAALRPSRPQDPVWDYAIGHAPKNLQEEVVFWLEVHPATDGEIKKVLNKLQWLKQWLKDEAPELKSLRKQFVWVSSGKTSFTLSSPQQKQIAEAGLQLKGRLFHIRDQY